MHVKPNDAIFSPLENRYGHTSAAGPVHVIVYIIQYHVDGDHTLGWKQFQFEPTVLHYHLCIITDVRCHVHQPFCSYFL